MVLLLVLILLQCVERARVPAMLKTTAVQSHHPNGPKLFSTEKEHVLLTNEENKNREFFTPTYRVSLYLFNAELDALNDLLPYLMLSICWP